jgi:hypothetical protein
MELPLSLDMLKTIVSYIQTDKLSVLLTCKRFYYVGKFVYDPSADSSGALRWSCRNNKLDCIR